MKKQIDVFEHSTEIVKALKEGVLLTTKSGNRVNTMKSLHRRAFLKNLLD